jgi:hypothetical protein
MSNETKTSAARSAQMVPVPAGGPLPAAFFSPISAFFDPSPSFLAALLEVVTVKNSYGQFYEVLRSFCWNSIFYNHLQPFEERPVTFVTLPQPYNFFLLSGKTKS